MKPILIASSSTLKGIEKMLNQYFYSTTYRISSDFTITNFKGICNKVFVKKDGTRYKLYQKQ